MAAESSPPLGESVLKIVFRVGIPPTELSPGFQAVVRSAGRSCAESPAAPQARPRQTRRTIRVLIIGQIRSVTAPALSRLAQTLSRPICHEAGRSVCIRFAQEEL